MHELCEERTQCFLIARDVFGIGRVFAVPDRAFEDAAFVFADQLTERFDVLQKVPNVGKWAETAESFKGSDRDCHFGFVIVVRIVLRVPRMQLFRKLLVWMCLNG